MKRMIAFFLVLVLLMSGAAAEESREEKPVYSIQKRTFPVFIVSPEEPVLEAFPLYFVNQVDDVPYVEMTDIANLIALCFDDEKDGKFFTAFSDYESGEFTLTRNINRSFVTLQFRDGDIVYSEIETLYGKTDSFMIDLVSYDLVDAEGTPLLFQRIPSNNWNRRGSALHISLSDYGIPMICQDGMMLMPFHTAFDLLVSLPQCYLHNYFNGEAIFLGTQKHIVDDNDVLQPLGEKYMYMNAKRSERSEELATLGLAELCMELDHFYGLKESHKITSFGNLLINTELGAELLDKNPLKADEALRKLIEYYMDDLHSGYQADSYLTHNYKEEHKDWNTRAVVPGDTAEAASAEARSADITATGLSRWRDMAIGAEYDAAFSMAKEEEKAPYYEVDDTAYVRFNHFNIDLSKNYYPLHDADLQDDTIDLILYAHQQITRENSPIRNVVLDLSLNSGGSVDAAIFVMAWFLGEAPFCQEYTSTGSLTASLYRADVNLDGKFDERDTVSDKNLYCLISPESFSCGNLLPWVFKTSGRVTLIGDTSGGGACAVKTMTTMWGTSYRTSGPKRISFVKNGSYYDVDRGIDPDIHLTRKWSYYDREALTRLIQRLD